MRSNRIKDEPIFLFLFIVIDIKIKGVSAQFSVTCKSQWSPCYCRLIRCSQVCPNPKSSHPKAKGCFLDYNSPTCEAVCRGRKPSCEGVVGAGYYDPRFIGSDGVVFYFHGKKGEHFSLISQPPNQRTLHWHPTKWKGMRLHVDTSTRLMFGHQKLSIGAARANQWDDSVDHFNFSFDSMPVQIRERQLSEWQSSDNRVKVERTRNKNSAMISIDETAKVEDDKVPKYGIPSDDCFAHLEVQFRFLKLSPEVEGVLRRTYRQGFENPAKPGVEMPVVGGEDKYQTTSLLSSDCKMCLFSPEADS